MSSEILDEFTELIKSEGPEHMRDAEGFVAEMLANCGLKANGDTYFENGKICCKEGFTTTPGWEAVQARWKETLMQRDVNSKLKETIRNWSFPTNERDA